LFLFSTFFLNVVSSFLVGSRSVVSSSIVGELDAEIEIVPCSN